jgi:acetyltransferase
MQRMIEFARAKGLQRIHGQVLGENITMLAMCGELGFEISDDPMTADVKVVTLDLRQAPASPA